MRVHTALGSPTSYARRTEPRRDPLRVGVVQHAWQPDSGALRAALESGIAEAAGLGAQAVFLPELTLYKYPADERAAGRPGNTAESLRDGPTVSFATEIACTHGLVVHASLYERADGEDGLGYNTSVLVSPAGELLGRTRKLHIPRTEGYHEDT